jgi:hypothetical protein
MARPTKYKKEFCEQLVKFMSGGNSVINFCASIGITKDTFFRWVKEKEAFSDAYKKAFALCETFWENIGKRGILGLPITDAEGKEGHVNPALFCFYMKNRFHWTDRLEQKTDIKIKTVDPETLEKLKTIFGGADGNK